MACLSLLCKSVNRAKAGRYIVMEKKSAVGGKVVEKKGSGEDVMAALPLPTNTYCVNPRLLAGTKEKSSSLQEGKKGSRVPQPPESFPCKAFALCSGGYAQELCLDALFNPPSSLCGAAVTSFAGWDLAMLQVGQQSMLRRACASAACATGLPSDV